jgi:hypothetical protein
MEFSGGSLPKSSSLIIDFFFLYWIRFCMIRDAFLYRLSSVSNSEL